MKKLVVVGKILVNEAINVNVKRMVIDAPQIADLAQPGQFVHVKKMDSVNFLRRPFSIADVNKDEGTITLIYRIVGKGTAEYAELKVGEQFSYSELKVGEQFNILGPIGNGFELKSGRPLLIGGGVGIAPLIYLARKLKDEKPILLIGGKNKDEVFWKDYLEEFAYITTDDGSVGFKGFTIQLLPQILAENKIEHIYTCGPNIMMEGVAKLAHEQDIDCQVSLEKRMACGIGVCLGCTFEGKLTKKRRKVCTEGPVFPSKEVF